MPQSFNLEYFTKGNPLNAKIADNMVDVQMLQWGNGKYEARAFLCFSRAEAIYNEIMKEDQPPVWKLPTYYETACCGYKGCEGDWGTIFQGVTLSIVLIYMEHCGLSWQEKNKAFIQKMKSYVNDMTLTTEGEVVGIKTKFPIVEKFSDVYETLRRDTGKVEFNSLAEFSERVKEVIDENTASVDDCRAVAAEISFTENEAGNRPVAVVENPSVDDLALKNQNQKLQADVERLTSELDEAKKKLSMLDEWHTGEYKKLPEDVEFVLRERVVFFATVLSLDIDKKFTVLSNLATFISELCNDQHNVGPFLSRMKKPEEAARNAKAAKKVTELMKDILPDEYQNDKHLKINQLINSMLLNFPSKEEE